MSTPYELLPGARVISPAEARRWVTDPEHVPHGSITVYDAVHTVVEMGREAEAAEQTIAQLRRELREAQARAFDAGYEACREGVQQYHSPHRPHRNLGACQPWCSSNGVPS